MFDWIVDLYVKLTLKSRKKDLTRLLEDQRIATVGRVSDWLKDPESRYPVSCTQLSVEDSMEGDNGIEFSWLYASKGLRYGAGVAIDLSKLRAKGNDNGRGLTASGPVSFAKIYSSINEELRRGGKFKNGAIVVFLNYSHPDLELFLDSHIGDWAKKAVYVSDNPDDPDYPNDEAKLKKLLYAVRAGTVWLSKKRWYDPETKRSQNYPVIKDLLPLNYRYKYDLFDGYRLYGNVCQEILIFSRGTCLLSHINLGKCTSTGLVEAFSNGMTFLCKLHSITGAGKDNFYRKPSEDKQVGLGVVGLANFLAQNEVTYKQFAEVLYDYGTGVYWENKYKYNAKALELVVNFYDAFAEAANVARKYKMQRAFTVAPTASASYRHLDKDNYTLAPEISPPIAHPVTKKTVRDSDTFSAMEYVYPPNVETAAEVGWPVYWKLVKGWQLMMDSTGLAHSMSVNIWNECPVDTDWFWDWMYSPLVTTYYRMLAEQAYADKSTIYSLPDDIEEEEGDFFKPVDEEEESEIIEGFCPLNSSPGECSACSETL